MAQGEVICERHPGDGFVHYNEQCTCWPDKEKPEADAVSKPRHYVVTLADGRELQCREVIRALGLNFALANVLKYLWRAGRKTPDRLVDLRKAADYLADEIDHG